VTFKELDEMTDVLVTKLRSIGVGKKSMVGILIEQYLEYTISYIAIHEASTYVIIICLLLVCKVLTNYILKSYLYRGCMFNPGGNVSITTYLFGFRGFDSQSNSYKNILYRNSN